MPYKDGKTAEEIRAVREKYGRHKWSDNFPTGKDRGSQELFKKTLIKQNKARAWRCQAFSNNLLRKGLRAEEAQCPRPALKGRLAVSSGKRYCKHHWKRIDLAYGNTKANKNKKPPTMAKELVRYKNSIPPELMPRLVEALNDPNKYSMEAEIDIVTARVGQLLERIDERQSRSAWAEVRRARNVLTAAIKDGDPQGITTGMSMLNRAINEPDYKVWEEVVYMIRQRASLVESVVKVQLAQKQAITIEEMIIILGHIQGGLLDIIKDKNTRLDVSHFLLGLLEAQPLMLQSGEDTIEGEIIGCSICTSEDFLERNPSPNRCPGCDRKY